MLILLKLLKIVEAQKLKDPKKNNIFTGEFWTGKTALQLGLVDGLVMLIKY